MAAIIIEKMTSSRLTAILQAVFVTFLWSTSWVLIKFGLHADLPPITFAGLRYMFAFACLAPLVFFNPQQRRRLVSLSRSNWWRLGILGLLYYTLTQGALFVSLAYLPAATLNLVLNLTSVVIGMAGALFLNERPSYLQWSGVALSAAGTGIYFLPVAIPQSQVIGLIAAIVCMLANALAVLLGREINRSGQFSPWIVTFVSMGVGSVLMLFIGLLTQGLGTLTWQDWAIIAWLAIVNTALAFTLWNHTLRTLTAVESSLINNLMMPQIAILAFLFLGETLTGKEVLGLILVGVGVLVVQLRQHTVNDKP